MSRDLQLTETKFAEIEKEANKKITDLESKLKAQESEYQKKLAEANIAIKEVESQKNKALSDLTNMTGHQNHNQKIQYLEKMKTELQTVQKENATLKAKLKRLEGGTKEKENVRAVRR